MNEESRRELCRYRMESAIEHLKASRYLLDGDFIKDSIGRSYYAMFSAARALEFLYNRRCGSASKAFDLESLL